MQNLRSVHMLKWDKLIVLISSSLNQIAPAGLCYLFPSYIDKNKLRLYITGEQKEMQQNPTRGRRHFDQHEW
jgi:hypothetical protein